MEDDAVGNQSFMWPTKGVFTSGFGWRWGRMHKGIDIANNVGTPIVAARDGIVKFSGWSSGYGYLVELAHSDGSSTRYAHNSRLLVRKGQIIPQGVKISLMGSTGRSTGPHLHFEIRQRGGSALDPMAKLPARRRA
jgi:murein DD-endopeptidase MepM/ murein hydrolase activator NlpD